MNNDLTKLAYTAIKQLQQENKNLTEQLNKNNEAVKLAFELYFNGQLATEQLENKIHEFSTKTDTEIEVIKKASELTKVASNMSSFKLSNKSSYEKLTARDRFESFLMEDL